MYNFVDPMHTIAGMKNSQKETNNNNYYVNGFTG